MALTPKSSFDSKQSTTFEFCPRILARLGGLAKRGGLCWDVGYRHLTNAQKKKNREYQEQEGQSQEALRTKGKEPESLLVVGGDPFYGKAKAGKGERAKAKPEFDRKSAREETAKKQLNFLVNTKQEDRRRGRTKRQNGMKDLVSAALSLGSFGNHPELYLTLQGVLLLRTLLTESHFALLPFCSSQDPGAQDVCCKIAGARLLSEPGKPSLILAT